MHQWIIDNGKLKIMVFPAEIIEIVRKAHTINSQLSIFNSQFLLGVSLINNHLQGYEGRKGEDMNKQELAALVAEQKTMLHRLMFVQQ